MSAASSLGNETANKKVREIGKRGGGENLRLLSSFLLSWFPLLLHLPFLCFFPFPFEVLPLVASSENRRLHHEIAFGDRSEREIVPVRAKKKTKKNSNFSKNYVNLTLKTKRTMLKQDEFVVPSSHVPRFHDF